MALQALCSIDFLVESFHGYNQSALRFRLYLFIEIEHEYLKAQS